MGPWIVQYLSPPGKLELNAKDPEFFCGVPGLYSTSALQASLHWKQKAKTFPVVSPDCTVSQPSRRACTEIKTPIVFLWASRIVQYLSPPSELALKAKRPRFFLWGSRIVHSQPSSTLKAKLTVQGFPLVFPDCLVPRPSSQGYTDKQQTLSFRMGSQDYVIPQLSRQA